MRMESGRRPTRLFLRLAAGALLCLGVANPAWSQAERPLSQLMRATPPPPVELPKPPRTTQATLPTLPAELLKPAPATQTSLPTFPTELPSLAVVAQAAPPPLPE